MAEKRPSVPVQHASAASGAPTGLLGGLQSEVSVEAAPLLGFIARHATLIMTLLALFVLVVVGIGARQWYVDKRDEEARLDLSRLTARQQSPAKLEALERFASSAPDAVRVAALMELGLSALADGDVDKAAVAYGRAAALDKDQPMGLLAALSQAEVLVRAGKNAEAVTLLETLENTVSESMRPRVRNLLAVAAVRAGKPERAVKAYEDLAAGARGDDAAFYRFRIEQLRAAGKDK